LPTSTDSEETLSTARFWLKECLKEHTECGMRSVSRAKSAPVKLPTRLIYFGEAQGQLAPRLVLTSASSTLEATSYFTLSPSWSITTKATSLKLRTENLQKLQEAIPLESLPQTFRNAMGMTRRLGYQYIWIDSLCIIQDSHEDWENEAVTMCDVHGNSACTIAASGPAKWDRCYVQLNPLPLFPCHINVANHHIPVYAIPYDWNWDFDEMNKDSHIFQRGWIMQERLLSSRVIFTGHSQFHWECCHFRTNEAFTFAFGAGPNITQLPKLTFHALCDSEHSATDVAHSTGMPLDPDILEVYSLWTKLLSDYTKMDLSYQSDKLMALAGIVKAVQDSRGWTNVAGTWKEFWPLELLWRPTFSKMKAKLTPTGLGLPSWSWAATE
ncbi:heterokaryon incompatibility protein-domain-containing protein, partial [Sordaria sp. MPI-SDFR-AT-0083]